MHWQDEKTISVYDLSNDENRNSGDSSIKYQKSNLTTEKVFDHFHSSHHEKLIQLRTKPSQSLHFSPTLNPVHLKLYNDNSFPIIFKLKTTQPDIITSQPARGFIQANSFIECHLTPIEKQYPILLIVQYAQILNAYDDYITQWKNLKCEHIHIKKFQCLFQGEKEICRKQTLLKPILFTFATITLLTTLIYFRNK